MDQETVTPIGPWRRMWRTGVRILRSRTSRYALGLGVVALLAWAVHDFLAHPLPGAYVSTPFEGVRLPPLERRTADGLAYTVNPGRAIVSLDVGDEDAASRRIFPSYAAALRHAREQGLPSLPSASLVLAAGRALDARLLSAVERQLELGEQGRPALLARWLAAVLELRGRAPPALQPACARAARHLATAILLGGGRPQVPADLAVEPPPDPDPALGPWGEADDLRRIWRRDRHLADQLTVADAAAAAVLARTLSGDAQLAAGWARQAAVAAAWAGPAAGATFEELAPVLAAIPEAQLAEAAAVAVVQAVVAAHPRPDGRPAIAPAAMAWVASPEEQVLAPLGMAAWDDPIAALSEAVAGGRLDLTPGPGAGFYRRRWYALETLAAPQRAPETLKLQLSADFARRWQRAFAAGFSEGRSGMVKRLPEISAGLHGSGPVPVEVAPQFTAEPAPAVYLRLARAYRMLAVELAPALGAEAWRGLRDAQGAGLAEAVDGRASLLFGLGASVCAELGFPLPRQAEEKDLDVPAARTLAGRWAAAAEDDPDVLADARLLVTLVADPAGRHRCPAIIGVRLEPVVCRWVEEPDVSRQVEPRFVPARWWLPSPCPLVATLATVPAPAAFRARCDGQTEVAAAYAAFGQAAPALRQAARPWWPWVLAVAAVLIGIAVSVVAWRRLRRPGTRRLAVTTVVVAIVGLVAWGAIAPPYPLVRFVAAVVVPSHPNIALLLRDGFGRWSEAHGQRLFFDLIGDPDPQVRYVTGWLPINFPSAHRDPAELAKLRTASDDAIQEVAWMAWFYRCRSDEPVADLVAAVEATNDHKRLWERLGSLIGRRGPEPSVQAVALRLAETPVPERRLAVLRALAGWADPPPAIIARIRAAFADPSPAIRQRAVGAIGELGEAEDFPGLLALLRDVDAGVRIAAFRAIGHRVVCRVREDGRPRWTDSAIQAAVVGYAADPAMTADERLSAGWRIADPATLRRISLDLLAVAEALPPSADRYPRSDQYFTTRWTRETAQARLVVRWLLAEGYVEATEAAYAESDEDLSRHGELLAQFVAAMRQGGGLPEGLRILESALVREDGTLVVFSLIERLGCRAASLADPVIAYYRGATGGHERRHVLNTLIALGPTVAGRVVPLLQALARDPEERQWAERRLAEFQEGPSPEPVSGQFGPGRSLRSRLPGMEWLP